MGPSPSSFCLAVHHQSASSASSRSQIKDISRPSNSSTCTTTIRAQATSLLPQRLLHHHLLVDSHFGYLSLFVRAKPTAYMWHAHAPRHPAAEVAASALRQRQILSHLHKRVRYYGYEATANV